MQFGTEGQQWNGLYGVECSDLVQPDANRYSGLALVMIIYKYEVYAQCVKCTNMIQLIYKILIRTCCRFFHYASRKAEELITD